MLFVLIMTNDVDYCVCVCCILLYVDPHRRGLELGHVRRHHGIWRAVVPWHAGLHLLHHPLHLRKLYPFTVQAQHCSDLKGSFDIPLLYLLALACTVCKHVFS